MQKVRESNLDPQTKRSRLLNLSEQRDKTAKGIFLKYLHPQDREAVY